MEFFPIEITRKYRWKLTIFAKIVNYLSCHDSAQYPSYMYSDDSSDFLIISLFYEKIFLFGLINAFKKFSVNCYVSASWISANHFWPKTSSLKLLSSRHRIFVSFSEHTGSILQSSKHLFMSSRSRGYLTVQTELDTRWIIFCRYVVVLWFVFGKN